jgi:hypothetical protein
MPIAKSNVATLIMKPLQDHGPVDAKIVAKLAPSTKSGSTANHGGNNKNSVKQP